MIVCKYKFDKSIYSNLIPIFNDGYNGYTVSDVTEGNIVTRTIECSTLPSLIRFGNSNTSSDTTAREHSLLYVYEVAVGTNIITGYCMFRGCKNLSNIEGCDKWDTSNVTNMSGMFSYCRALTSIDANNWDTSNVTDMSNMFYHSDKLTTLDISNWNVSKVTNMATMFGENTMLQSLDLSNWDTSKVTSMFGMFFGCYALTSLDVSNFDTSVTTNMKAMFGQMRSIKTLNLNNIKAEYSKAVYSDDDRFMINDVNLEKIYLNDLDTLNTVLHCITDRTGKEAGKLVTSLRNKIPAETLTTLTTKNWEIVDLVAQYKYDANTYEDLIPEFNTEFSSDKYEIYDSVSEIVIDDIVWEKGSINGSGYNTTTNNTSALRTKYYYSVIPGIMYNFKFWTHYYWYDKDKNIISYSLTGTSDTKVAAPNNAKYVRLLRGSGSVSDTYNMVVSAKLITRSIESVNGDLPTLMRFGRIWVNGETDTDSRTDSLLKVLDMNTSGLTSCSNMFRYNKNLTSINCNWDTSNVNSMYQMFYNCKSLASLDVNNFSTSNVTNMNSMFTNCTNLTSLDVSNFDTSNVTEMSWMFQNCNNLTSLDVSNFDTKSASSITAMFRGCSKLTTLDVSGFDTTNVTNMYEMFYGCTNLTSLDVSNFNTSKVTNMSSMFYNCNNLTSLDLSNFDTSKVTNMYAMLYQCHNLTSIGDVSNWDTSKVTTMEKMFNNCTKLTSLDVSNFDTSKVTNIAYMFSGCASLTSIDVSNFDTSKVTNIAYMFGGCSKLQTVGDLTNWNTKNLELCHALFYRCFKLKYAHIGGWNTSKVINVRSMFAGCESIETIDMHNFDFKNAYNDTGELFKYDMFQLKYLRINDLLGNDYAIDMIPSRTGKEQGVLISDVEISEETLTKLEAKNWTIVTSDTLTKVAEYVYDSKIWRSMIPTFNDEFIDYFIDDVEDENGLVTRTISSMGGLPTLMRFGSNLDTYVEGSEVALLKILNMNTSELTSIARMFRRCSNLTNISCNWDTSKVNSMNSVFATCSKLTQLDVSNFDVSKVANMQYMFNACLNLTELDLSNWDTSNLKYADYMFNRCSNLTQLDLSNWDMTNIINTSYMFNNCQQLTQLDISNWDMTNANNTSYMFNSTNKLTDIGMLYCTPSTINTISSALPTTHTQTIWVKDTDINKLTSVSGVEFKEYKENSYMINLSSPLLDGDRIEVVDGKLCHYHKMSKVVLDGSENWQLTSAKSAVIRLDSMGVYMAQKNYMNNILCDKLKGAQIIAANSDLGIYMIGDQSTGNYQQIRIRLTLDNIVENVKQWLSENPTTVVYELAEPYYEDITPIQSDITLETYLESNLDIYTKLPIKTNVSYITNVPSLSTLSMRATEMKESDNIIANLTNMLDNEINE